MEPWKVILLVAALPAGIAAGLSYMNGNTMREKIEERERQQQNVITIQGRLDNTIAEIQQKEQDTRDLNQDTESTNTQLAQAESKLFELNAEIEAMNTQLEQAKVDIAKLDKIEEAMGLLTNLNESIAAERQKIADEEQKLTAAQNMLSVRNARKADLERTISKMETEAKNRSLGIIPNDIDATVINSYNNWGFIVVDAGDAEGMVKNATLDVYRNGKPVGKVRVKEVMPHESVAEIMSTSLIPGQLIQVGDSIVHRVAPTL